ncbi:MAG: hypothetical protein IMW93_09025 [Thermoanaerobacteraceae bacterium]|nr:hypothetical protein [Thermoanaerobacteraceae bacterium]
MGRYAVSAGEDLIVGQSGYAVIVQLGIYSLKNRRAIIINDARIADRAGLRPRRGRLPKGTLVDEQYLLDLEREAFLSLIAEPKTRAIMDMPKTGKPLRN